MRLAWKTLAVLAAAVLAALAAAVYEPRLDPEKARGLRVVVTGATSGIGLEVARRYGELGAKVVLVARTESKLRKAAEECRALGAQGADYVVADLSTDDDAVYASVIKAAVEKLGGGLDTLVLNHVSTTNNFVRDGWTAVRDMSIMRNMFEINAFSHMSLTHHALDELTASKGNIVFVSSLTGRRGMPKGAPYCATKHAMVGFLESLRLDLALEKSPVDITICTIGSIDTESTEAALAGTRVASVPRGSAEDCAQAIVAGGQRRVREVVFPASSITPMLWLSFLAPSVAEAVITAVYS